MKLSFLKKILANCDDGLFPGSDPEVVVVIKSGRSIGSTPCVKIKDAACGIDWDHGKFMLHPEMSVKLDCPDAPQTQLDIDRNACWPHWSVREIHAIQELAKAKEMSPAEVVRQALRFYKKPS